MRPVTITRQDEKQAVIAAGVTAGEKLVTSGFGRLKDGATVSVSDAHSPVPTDGDANAPARRQSSGKSAEEQTGNQQASEAPASSPLVTGSNSPEGTPVEDAMEDDAKSGGRHNRRHRENGASP